MKNLQYIILQHGHNNNELKHVVANSYDNSIENFLEELYKARVIIVATNPDRMRFYGVPFDTKEDIFDSYMQKYGCFEEDEETVKLYLEFIEENFTE